MRDDYRVRLEIGEGTVYADTVEDLSIIVNAIRAESQGSLLAMRQDVETKGRRLLDLEAELRDYKETAVYGPQLHAEKQAAIDSRDAALERERDLLDQMKREREAHMAGDRTRRALTADVRRLVAERDQWKSVAEFHQRKAKKKGARKR